MMTPLLDISDLRVTVGGIPVLRGVNFNVLEGGWTGIVGESGSGKSMTALAVLGLLPRSAKVEAGFVSWQGTNLLGLSDSARRALMGRDLGMIFQDPRSALNPLMTVGAQLRRAAQRGGYSDVRRVAIEFLGHVGLPDPVELGDMYPHQLSGGMCQRVMIAMMLAVRPRLLIADEPTTALDVTVQAQILELLHRVQQEIGTTVVLISHDLGVVAEHCDRVGVMYGGTIVESGPTQGVFHEPRHPYTSVLTVDSLAMGSPADAHVQDPIGNDGVSAHGCVYATRCEFAQPMCREASPALETVTTPDHAVACVRSGELPDLARRMRVL